MNMNTKQHIGVAIFSAITFALATQLVFSNGSMKQMDVFKKNVEEAYDRHYTEPITISIPELGTVVLTGTVNTYWDKLNIFSIIAKVNGVIKIKDELMVVTNPVPSDIIKAEILQEYRRNRLILEPDSIKVAVNDGMVILNGTVSFNKESVAAEDIASWWEGVKSVDNNLNVLPPGKAESDENLTAVAQDVLKDEFSVGGKMVKAKVTQGIVELTGTVENLWLKDSIDKEMHSILGIRDVTDNLTVVPRVE